MNKRQSFYDVSSFYNKKAVLKCSFKGMRYQVEGISKDDDVKVLQADVWPEPFCYEKTPLEFHTTKEFEYSENGLDEVYEWICSQYESRKEEWDFALKNPLEKARQMGIIG
jgi:acetyltransferase, GNAT family